MRPYTRDELREIIRIRADEEEIPLTDEALEVLTDIAEQRSLRYAIQLMEPARIIAEREGRTKVAAEDVKRAASYFVDVRESVEYIREFEKHFLR